MEHQAVIQRSGGEHKGFFSLFSIKPYQNRLLTPGAGYWIACAHLVVFVMAMSEAIAWGYLGSLFGKGLVGYVAAGIAFLFMFAIIWVIDVSFVTMDLSRSFYDRAILKQDTEKWQDRARMSAGLVGRIAIVVVSLSISAPFLSQIVFKQDIDNEIHRRNMASVSVVRDSLLAGKAADIASLDSLIQAREAELIQETAGKGSSGNYGYGPVTQTMERNLERLRSEREEALGDRIELENTLKETSFEVLAAQYNVDLIDNGVQAREAVLSGLMQNSEYRTAKRAVTAFLAFIFAALVLLKLFQPRSVRIYYNEKLQDLFREYLSGNLNKWISKEEQCPPDGEPRMSPLRFEDWCINTYGVVRSEDIKRRESRKIYNLFKMKIEQLEEEKAEIKRMLEPIEIEFDEAMKEVSQIKIDLLQADSDIVQCSRNQDDVAGQLASIDDDLSNSRFRGSDVLIAVTAKKDLEEKLATHKNDAIALQHRRNLILHKLDVKQNEAADIEKLIDKIRANYRDVQDKIDAERLAYTDMIVAGQVIDFPRNGEEPVQHEEPAPALEDLKTEGESMAERFQRHPFASAPRAANDEPAVINTTDTMDEEADDESPADNDDTPAPRRPDTPPLQHPDTPARRHAETPALPLNNKPEEKTDALPWDMDEPAPIPAPGAPLFPALDAALAEDDPAKYDEDSPVEFVDDERLNAYAEAASLSEYEEDEPEEPDFEGDGAGRPLDMDMPLWRLLQARRDVEPDWREVDDLEPEEIDEEEGIYMVSDDEDTSNDADSFEEEEARHGDNANVISEDVAIDEEPWETEDVYDDEDIDMYYDEEPEESSMSEADVIEAFLRRRDDEAYARHGGGIRKGAFGRPFDAEIDHTGDA